MVRELILTIEAKDVGKRVLTRIQPETGKEVYHLEACLGRVLKHDIGKRVYRIDHILCVESNAQRDERISKGS